MIVKKIYLQIITCIKLDLRSFLILIYGLCLLVSKKLYYYYIYFGNDKESNTFILMNCKIYVTLFYSLKDLTKWMNCKIYVKT